MAGDDTDKKAPSIPSWQNPSRPPSSTPSSPEPDSDETPALNTLEHARRFLDDESIKNATHERKVAFLESKGLKPEQIQDLLSPDIPNTEADADSDLKTVHDSTTTVDPSTLQPQPQPQQAPLQNTLSSEARVTPRTDIPPIITYPEFLLKPQKPPPLVTFERLANAAYTLAGLSALTYGASKYLVSPMLESLTDSRHSPRRNHHNLPQHAQHKTRIQRLPHPLHRPSKQTKQHLRRHRLHRLRPHRALPQGHRDPDLARPKPQQLLQLPHSTQPNNIANNPPHIPPHIPTIPVVLNNHLL